MNNKTNKHKSGLPRIGISLGDPNGVGPEIILKVLSDSRLLNLFTPVIYASTKVISYYKKKLNLDSFTFQPIKYASQASEKKVNILNCWQEAFEIKPGEITETGGKYAFLSLDRIAQDLKKQEIDGVVTAPINKHNIQNESFSFPGHTEFFTEMDGKKDSLMFLCSGDLRVGVVTGHVPLAQVPGKITAELLRSKINILKNTLHNDFNINKPRIAILGLNPHAGEDGLLGSEENEIIKPVIKEFKRKGELIVGPFPSDGFFGNGQFKQYDGVLAMYHDQGLIPFKTLAFESGVNYTAGLSIIRTSPDHGTAYGIAGKGVADPTSFREAVYLAIDVIKNRQERSGSSAVKKKNEVHLEKLLEDESNDFPLEKLSEEELMDSLENIPLKKDPSKPLKHSKRRNKE